MSYHPLEQRRAMVDGQLRARGIQDPRVLEAMGRIARERFVPEYLGPLAYKDSPLDIGFEQTISQPYITALMVQELALAGGEKVLEVGTGSGYHAAVLASLARRVVTIELIPQLAEQARRNLFETGLDANVLVLEGDGSEGCLAEAPYDAISVAAAAPGIPEPLLEQLRDPGRLVIPVGGEASQDLLVIEKRDGQTHKWRATGCLFVPLRGKRGWR